MKISFENPDKINGKLTIVVEEADYKDDVEKALKKYRNRANVPGFRPGKAPMSMIKREFEPSVKVDTINEKVSEAMSKYITDNKIQMLGQPLTSDSQEKIDVAKDAPYTFVFDVAVAPEFKVSLTGRDKVDYYNITVDDELVGRQVDMFCRQMGKNEQASSYQPNDMLEGDLRELGADGSVLEGGLTIEKAHLLPEYIKVDDQKKLFDGAKAGDVITFNPRKAYEDNDAEMAALLKINIDDVKDHTGDFSYQITAINRFVPHAVDQELFDQVYGKDEVKDEKAFREKIAEGLKEQLKGDEDYKFLLDVRAHCEKKVGKLTFPDALLKKIMLLSNKDKDEKYVDEHYDDSIKELTWHLIKEQLVKAQDIKIDDNDIKETAKEAARAQFMQYGMNNVPEEYVDQFADRMLKQENNQQAILDRAVDRKLTEALKKVVKLNEKEISVDDFNKMMQE